MRPIRCRESRQGSDLLRHLFVEPVLPLTDLIICGDGLVAMALSDLATRLDFNVTMQADMVQLAQTPDTAYVVIATQGKGDLAALKAISGTTPRYVSFVGSQKKFETLITKLANQTPPHIKAPAGLDINAITPDEIALSILAEITQIRRAKTTQMTEGPQP